MLLCRRIHADVISVGLDRLCLGPIHQLQLNVLLLTPCCSYQSVSKDVHDISVSFCYMYLVALYALDTANEDG